MGLPGTQHLSVFLSSISRLGPVAKKRQEVSPSAATPGNSVREVTESHLTTRHQALGINTIYESEPAPMDGADKKKKKIEAVSEGEHTTNSRLRPKRSQV